MLIKLPLNCSFRWSNSTLLLRVAYSPRQEAPYIVRDDGELV